MRKWLFLAIYMVLAEFLVPRADAQDAYNQGYNNGYNDRLPASTLPSDSDYSRGVRQGQGGADDDDIVQEKMLRWQQKSDERILEHEHQSFESATPLILPPRPVTPYESSDDTPHSAP